MTTEQCFDYLSICLDGATALALGTCRMHWTLTDTGESLRVELSNGTLHTRAISSDDAGRDASVTTTRATLEEIVGVGAAFADLCDSGAIALAGDAATVRSLFGLVQSFNLFFPIIEP